MRFVLSLLFLASCSSTPKASPPTTKAAATRPTSEMKLECPSGTTQQSYERRFWCASPEMIRSGPMVLYDFGGQIIEEGTWKNNAPIGLWTYRDKTSKQIAQIDMKDGDGVWPSFYDDGTKASEQTYKAGKLNGPTFNWSPFGQVMYEGGYQDGRLHGVIKSFFENGKPSAEVNYVEGETHGVTTRWNEAGEKISEHKYHYGTQIEETLYEKGVAQETKKTPLLEPTYTRVANKEHPKIKREWQSCQENAQCRTISTRCCACGAQDVVGVHYKFMQEAQRELLLLSTCKDNPCPSQMCQQTEAVCLENFCASAE